MDKIDLSIIVVAWNVKELLNECFMALRISDDKLRKQILLVDNGSKDGSVDFVKKKFPEVQVIRSSTNLGFIRANNLAYTHAVGEFILMLNSDAFVLPDTIRKSVDFMRNTPEAGVTGAKLMGRDGSLQPSVRYFPTPFRSFLNSVGLDGRLPFIKPLDYTEWDHKSVRESDWVVGCFLLTRKKIIDETGFFLREDFFMYNDDNDLCKRIKKKGYKVFFYPVDVIHIGGANVQKMFNEVSVDLQVEKYQIESQMIYYRKNHWIGTVISDWFFIELSNFLYLAKKSLISRDREAARLLVAHMKLTSSIAFKTRLGSKSIH